MIRMRKLAKSFFCAAALLLGGCMSTEQITTVTGREFTVNIQDNQVKQLAGSVGHRIGKEKETMSMSDDVIVKCVVDTLLHSMNYMFESSFVDWKVRVNRDDRPYIFILKSGEIYASEGLVKFAEGNQEYLAYIVAHQFGHYFSRHFEERLSGDPVVQENEEPAPFYETDNAFHDRVRHMFNADGSETPLAFTPEQEKEADILAAEYLAKAGFKPDVALVYMNSLRGRSDNEYEKIHPMTSERMKDYQEAVEKNWDNYKYAVGKLGITVSCYHK